MYHQKPRTQSWVIISECDKPDQVAEDNLKQSDTQIPNRICTSFFSFFPLFADRIKGKKDLTIVVVIALIFSITGIGVWIASAVLLYSKFIPQANELDMIHSLDNPPTHMHVVIR